MNQKDDLCSENKFELIFVDKNKCYTIKQIIEMLYKSNLNSMKNPYYNNELSDGNFVKRLMRDFSIFGNEKSRWNDDESAIIIKHIDALIKKLLSNKLCYLKRLSKRKNENINTDSLLFDLDESIKQTGNPYTKQHIDHTFTRYVTYNINLALSGIFLDIAFLWANYCFSFHTDNAEDPFDEEPNK